MRIHETPNEGLALLALGGYGRKMLFPFSDLDILFLFENEKTEEEFRPFISEFSRHHVGPGIPRQQRWANDR